MVRINIFALFWILEGKFSGFTVKYDVRFGLFIYVLYYVDKNSIYTLLRVFIMKGSWTSSNAFPVSTEMIMWFISFILLTWCTTLLYFYMQNNPCILGIHPLHPRDTFQLIVVYNPFNVWLNLVVLYAVENFWNLYLSGILVCSFLFL